MIQNIARIPVKTDRSAGRSSSLSPDQLSRLARTYESAALPVWVHDLEERCVYRNPTAASVAERGEPLLIFDVVDHRGQAVGYVATGQA